MIMEIFDCFAIKRFSLNLSSRLLIFNVKDARLSLKNFGIVMCFVEIRNSIQKAFLVH